MKDRNIQKWFVVGLIVGAIVSRLILVVHHDQHGNHPVGYADNADEVHVHSDFIVYLAGEQVDFSADKYQSEGIDVRHSHIHLHDNNGEVIHRHGPDITLAEFFNSLGFTLTEDCITTDSDIEYCSNETEQLIMYVNNEPITPAASYVNQEEDRILLYFGAPDAPVISDLLDQVTDTACIYSGTCPERGVAPPESCGLTCEIFGG